MAQSKSRLISRIIQTAAVVLLLAPALSAQIPETFTNLEVLPKEIDRSTLVGLMRGMSGALGVRCTHCHVGEDLERLAGMDFASDAKEPKQIAREMMRMTQEINQELLPNTGLKSPREVRCVTCHHGLNRPETLKQALRRAFDDSGIDALTDHYGTLREKYYGEGVYDFGEFTLPSLAEQLHRGELVAAGDAVLRLNLEHFPASGYTYTMIGESKLRQRQAAEAVIAFEKALEIDPSNDHALRRIEVAKLRAKSPKTD
jgi:tetratricopeptide (TPR) repeat protein